MRVTASVDAARRQASRRSRQDRDSRRAFQAAISYHRQGRLPEAARLYEAVLRTSSDHRDSLHNLGLIRLQQGNAAEAAMLFRRALERGPKSFDAHMNLGDALAALQRHQEAIAEYRRALAIKPDCADAYNNIGIALQQLNCHDEAIAHYEKAVALDPVHLKAHNNLGTGLKMLGRIEQAQCALERAIASTPREAQARFYRQLSDCKRFAADDPQLAAMEALAEDVASLAEEQQIDLHFAMGKALAGINEYQRSFAHLLKGNALKRRQFAYDEPASLAVFDRIRAVFTPELLRNKQSFGDPSPVPVFVLGMPRSGTTLVEQILASHPKIFGAGERQAFGAAAARLNRADATYPETIAAATGKQLRQIGERYLAVVRASAPAVERIVDKMPANYLYAGLIHLALPNARIIHTRRDPVDTCLSCFSILFTGDQRFSYELGELGRYYVAYEKLMDHWRSMLPQGLMIEVQYEEVVADLEGQARRILAHCGLAWDDSCLAFHKGSRAVQTASAAQVRQPIYRSSIGRWLPYKAMLGPLLEALGVE